MKRHRLMYLVFFSMVLFLINDKEAMAITGSGTENDPYIIATADDLRAVGADLKGHYIQTADIDLKHEDFPMIGEYDNPGFQGSYDGQGYEIRNLKIIKDEMPLGTGLFAQCNNASISNINLVNPEIENVTNKSGYILGGIAGIVKDNTVIRNCTVTGDGYIKSGHNAGGIAGSLTNSTVIECMASIPVINSSSSGGIAGSCSGTCNIEKCYYTGDVTSAELSSANAGGIVGFYSGNNLKISECYSSGKLTSYSCTGGIVGKFTNGKLNTENCFSVSDITTNKIMNYTAVAGGLMGQATTHNVTNCYFAGTLNGTKNYGLAPSGTIKNCYFDGQKNNNVDKYVYSKNTSSMLKKVTYENWDFENIWGIMEDKTYPYLKNMPIPDNAIVVPSDINAEAITVIPSNKHMEIYDVLNLSYKITPQNVSDKTVSFTTSDSSVAIINNSNQIVAVGNGTAVVTITTSNGKSCHCNITVGTGIKHVPVEEFSISPGTKIMETGGTLQLFSKIIPENASNKNIKWMSTNENVISVDSNGYVTAKNIGFGAIVAFMEEGHHFAFCNVFVKGESENLALSGDAYASSYFSQAVEEQTNLPIKGNDGNINTYWRMSNYNKGEMFYELKFSKDIIFNKIKIIEHGNEIGDYRIQIWDDKGWIDIISGTGIGSNYSKSVGINCTKRIRILVDSRISYEKNRLPSISEFEVYYDKLL